MGKVARGISSPEDWHSSCKEHVAKEMMTYFLRHYRERGVPIAILYPFRPDFYKKMGFGYGTKMNQYRVKPAALPKGPSRAHVRYLDKSDGDRQAVMDCYNRFLDGTHGLIAKSAYELKRLMENPNHRILGYEKDGRIAGYLIFSFDKGDHGRCGWFPSGHAVPDLGPRPALHRRLPTNAEGQRCERRAVAF